MDICLNEEAGGDIAGDIYNVLKDIQGQIKNFSVNINLINEPWWNNALTIFKELSVVY